MKDKKVKTKTPISEKLLLSVFGFLIALVLFLLFFFLYPHWEMRPRVNVYVHKELIKLLTQSEELERERQEADQKLDETENKEINEEEYYEEITL